MFRLYSNTFSRATRGVAAFLFTIALILIGFGVLIIAFPEIFAVLAATIFFIAGGSCAIFAFKVFIASRRLRQSDHTEYPPEYSGGRMHELDDFNG